MSYPMAKQDKDMLYSFFDYYFYFNDVNETTKLKSKHKLATEIVDFFLRIRGYQRESLIVLVENEIPGYFLYTSGKPNYFDELKTNEPVMPAIPATAFQGMIKRDASLGSLTTSKWLRQAEQGYRQIDKNKKHIVVPNIQDYLVNRLATPDRAAAAALLPRERRKEFGQMIKTQVFDKKKPLPAPRIDDLFEPPETLVPIQRFEHLEKELYMAIRLQKDCLACLRLIGFLNKKKTPNISFEVKLHDKDDDDTDLLFQLRWERTSIFGDTTTRDPSVSTNRRITDWAREWKQRFPNRGRGGEGTLPGFNPYNRREDEKDWEGYSRPRTDVLVDLNTQMDRQKFKTPTKSFNEPPAVLPSDERTWLSTRRNTTHSPGSLFKKPQRVVCSKFEPGCLDGNPLSVSTKLKRHWGDKPWDDKTLLSSRSEHFTWEDAGAAFHTSVGVTDEEETSKKFEIFCFSNNKKSIEDSQRRRFAYDGSQIYDGFILIGPPASYYEFQELNNFENIKDYVVYMCLFILKLCQIIPQQMGDMKTKLETIQHNAVRLLQTYIPEREWPDLLATMTFEPPIYDGGGTKKNKSKKNKSKKNKLKINKTKKK